MSIKIFPKISKFTLLFAHFCTAFQSVAQTTIETPPRSNESSQYEVPSHPYVQPYSQLSSRSPKTLGYIEGQPIPYGYHLEERGNRGLIISGSIVFGTFWGLTFLGGLMSPDQSKTWPLYIPVFGPFMMLPRLKNTDGQAEGVAALFVIDGILQLAGATLLTFGVARKKKVLVRNDFANIRVTVSPVISSAMRGIGVMGEF